MRLLIPLLCLLSLAACNKEDNGSNNGPESPSVINFSAPASGVFVTNGSPLSVEGDITDTNGLTTARLEIRHRTTNVLLHQQSSNTGSVSFYRFQWTWTVTGISSTTPATVRVIARDRNGVEISKDRDITLDN